MIKEFPDFFIPVLTNSIVTLGVQSLMLKNQSVGDKLGDGFFDSGCLKLDRVFQQPPFHNTLQSVLSPRMLDKISQYLIANLGLIYWQIKIHTQVSSENYIGKSNYYPSNCRAIGKIIRLKNLICFYIIFDISRLRPFFHVSK